MLTGSTPIIYAGNDYWVQAKNTLDIPVIVKISHKYCVYAVVPQKVTILPGNVITFFIGTNDSGACNTLWADNATVTFIDSSLSKNLIKFSVFQNSWDQSSVDKAMGTFYSGNIPGQRCNDKGDPCFLIKKVKR